MCVDKEGNLWFSTLYTMERMRIHIASDLHNDIGSTLSSISLISEMAGSQDKESELAKALSKIGLDSRDVLNSMDDIIWSVNPQNDSFSSLVIRLREYAIPVCESKSTTFNINVDYTIYSMKLGMDVRRNIYLIVKEAINNALKQTGLNCVRLCLFLLIYPLTVKPIAPILFLWTSICRKCRELKLHDWQKGFSGR
jgi:glucose-6-phosphate-specific signal transduction histidine kinase